MDVQSHEEQESCKDLESRESPPSMTAEFQHQDKFVEGLFQSRDDLINYVKNFAKPQGYVVTIQKSEKDKFVTLGCDRGGTYRSRRKLTDNERKKQTCSRLINCPFKVKGTRRVDGSWSLKIKNREHNHKASKILLGHPCARRFSKEEVIKIKDMTSAHVQPRQMLTTLKQSNPELQIVPRDLYNMKAKIRKDNLAGRTTIQALSDELGGGGFKFYLKNDEEGQLTHVFFAHPLSIAMTKSYKNIFVMDCTCKTNQYKMPLLDILGVTSFKTNFFSCFAFLRNEEEEDYIWALKMFNNVMGDHFLPRVIVTDREPALMIAIRTVFPSSVNILCVRHVNKDVVANCKSQFDENEDWKGFLSEWAALVDSSSVMTYFEVYEALRGKYKEKPDVLNYIERTWIPHKECFVKAWTDKHGHFGNRAISTVEGAHSTLKSYLHVSNGDLHLVKNKICAAIENQFQKIKAQVLEEMFQVPHTCCVPFFDEIIGKISSFALNEIFQQYELAKSASLSYLCTNQFASTMGLPCAHMIKYLLNQNKKLHLGDVHSQWRIDNRVLDDVEVEINRKNGHLGRI